MKVIVTGPRGKMGKLITKEVAKRSDMELLGGIAPKGRDYIGLDIGLAIGTGEKYEALVYDNLIDIMDSCDVIIDYTTTEYSIEVIRLAKEYNKAVVCGTTGFSTDELEYIKDASKHIPIVYAANTSRLVNLMYELLSVTASAIGEFSDIEIIEMHDRNKKDAPSGTAREMGSVIAEVMNKKLNEIAVHGRFGKGERLPGSIGYHSIRSGDISSSHTVMFGLIGERLEITHHAYNWECFAKGACEAAAFVFGKEPGLYTVKDVLGL